MVPDPLHSLRPLARLWMVGGGLLGLAGGGLLLSGYLLVGTGCLAAAVSVLLLAGWHARQLRLVSAGVSRMAAEQRMQERATQHTGSPVIVTDNDGHILWCNRVFERDTGYGFEEVRGRHPGQFLRSPNADPVTAERIRDALRSRTDIDIEILHRYRDGKDRWVRVQLDAQHDAKGIPSGFTVVLIDIDAQVRTREALRRSLRYSSSLMRSLDEYLMVAEADTQGRFIRVNRRFQEVTGFSEDELLGQGFSRLSSGSHPPTFWRDMWVRIASGLPWQGEVCNRTKQGRLFWVQSLVAPMLGPDGSIEKYVSFQTDISTHRLAQIELAKSESLLRSTSQLAGVGGWTAQLDSGRLQMTPECCQLLGVQGTEVTDYTEFWRCFGQGVRLVIRAQLQELAQGRRDEVNLLASVRPRTGAPARWVRLVASLRESRIEGVGSMPDRVIGAVQDYTPQMLAQQRIREEQRILHSAMDAVGEAFALFDAQGLMVYCNEAYAALLPAGHPPLKGASRESVLRWLAEDGVFREAVGREDEWVQERLRDPVDGASGRIRQTADGRWLRFIDRVTADGHHVALRSDVSELQGALLRADAAAVSKGQFLANMSHEIRTPINAVMGLLDLLGRTQLAPQQADMVGKSLTAARSLLGILNDILDFSKIEAGKLELHAVPFRLADLHHELEVILAGARGSKPLELLFENDDSLPEVLVGDPVRLKQVLINLGGNAVKFTAAGHVRLGWRLLEQKDDRLRVHFEVSDTGIGIAPEQQARIFDSFSQAEASTTRRFGGSGLGLTISQRLVERMGGSIALDSTPGQGSTFSFDIDLQQGSEADLPAIAASAPEGSGPRLQGLRLLLAEDNPLNQEVALAVLRREGAEVQLAENGQLAVDVLAADPQGFDAVLMDMQMPVLDGLQATEQIREVLGLAELPVIAMTANAMQQDRERCLQAGMNAHIGKPFEVDQLVALILHFTRPGSPAAMIDRAPRQAVTSGEAPLREDTETLRRLGGDTVLLGQLRGRFSDTGADCLRRARHCTERADGPGAADALHQLKGAAGVVGACRLARTSEALERSLRADTAPDAVAALLPDIDELDQVLRATLAALDPVAAHVQVSATTPSPETTVALAACLGDLKAFKTLLDGADMAVIDEHEQWLARHPVAHGERFRAFNALMEAMDFEAASQACTTLLSEDETSAHAN